MLKKPVSVYINWAAYDELSDAVELTEALALRQLDELVRLRGLGVRFDYYLMDCFWFAKDGGYRTWRKPHWPDGPGRWLARCREAGVKPGLWVTANTLCRMDCPPAWRDSLDEDTQGLCCFYGGFLADFVRALHEWYEAGVRAFKFDFANFYSAPRALKNAMAAEAIRALNIAAWRCGMKAFKREHPEALFLGYNGCDEPGGVQLGTGMKPFRAIEPAWLEVFDSIYCGDPRPADVPAVNFWRSKDVYSDHMVRMYEWNDIPLSRIDNSGFMVGTTGTCYFRRTAAWQGMLILSLARGGWVNTYYGNLDLLDEEKGRWFARVQGWYLDLQANAHFSTFGGMPGEGQAYGFAALRKEGGLLAVVNPGPLHADLPLPIPAGTPLQLLFRDSGFVPILKSTSVRLGPEQMALVGVGEFADARHDLGVQQDVRIPEESRQVAEFAGKADERAIAFTLEAPPTDGRLRILLRQRAGDRPLRISGGSPPSGTPLGQLLRIAATQDGKEVPVAIGYDKAIWSGLSWAAGEVECESLAAGRPLVIRLETGDTRSLTLHGSVYHVR